MQSLLFRSEPGSSPDTAGLASNGGERRFSASHARIVKSAIESRAFSLGRTERDLLESRFGVSVSDIRLHAGPEATAAATLLDARAFTFGWHIVFNTDEYDPYSTAGLRLLAHELTHAIQQGNIRCLTSAMRLGTADDQLEQEAELVAERILSAKALPSIRRDVSPALRRVIIIKAPATTGVDIITTGAVAEPGTQNGATNNLVTFNLRRNFNSTNPRASGLAFKFTGHVGVTLDPGDPITDFTFGWVQFMKQVALTFVYAGREDAEGQIEINPLSLIGTKFLIDRDPAAGAAFTPFAQSPAANFSFDAVAKEAIANFGDHPMTIVPETRFNSTTRFDNFLFSVIDSRKLVSIFVVRDKFARFTPLAHVNTDLVYSGTFKWRNRTILPVSNPSSFTPRPFVKGAPTDQEIVGLMAKLSPSMAPAYNPTAQAAFATAFAPGSANRRDLDHYEARIPPLFFLEGRGSLDIP